MYLLSLSLHNKAGLTSYCEKPISFQESSLKLLPFSTADFLSDNCSSDFFFFFGMHNGFNYLFTLFGNATEILRVSVMPHA